jgi:hypothetical protein
MVFVFGSNEGGIHGAGSALYALQHEGAVAGIGVGFQGNSYAIPSKAVRPHRGGWVVGQTLPLDKIKAYVDEFILFAKAHSELQFKVARIGCQHAGLKNEQVAPLFADAPDNCFFAEEWLPFLQGKQSW